MQFTRSNPSPRYRSLIDLYQAMHAQGNQESGEGMMFSGKSLLPQVAKIKKLVDRAGAEILLDYGCGKARMYDLSDVAIDGYGTVESIVSFWDVLGVHLYDPAYAPHRKLPEGRFDGVIATDVLEHCPEEDIPWIVDEIFGYSKGFVFANVACYPALKILPNGENAHCTIQPPEWWDRVLRETAARHPDVQWWEVWVEDRRPDTRADTRLSNFDAKV